MHTMVTHYGGSGQPLDMDANMTRKDIDVDIPQDFHHEDIDNFENVEHENPTSLQLLPGNWMIYTIKSMLVKENPWKLYML